MNNLQLATTLVAPTGTGLLYTPFEQGSDTSVWVNGSGATRSRLAIKRVQAKPNAAFVGVERLDVKRTVYFTVNGIEYPGVVDIITSIPVNMPLADRTSLFTVNALIARDPVLQAAFETGALPT